MTFAGATQVLRGMDAQLSAHPLNETAKFVDLFDDFKLKAFCNWKFSNASQRWKSLRKIKRVSILSY
jgi:hypothetical protein